MNRLITADLHLDDFPLTSYRWKIFDDLYKWGVKYNINKFYILGDITEKKDNHSAWLTNKIVEGIDKLTSLDEMYCVYILMGNHDYHSIPFFEFLGKMEKVVFIKDVLIESYELFIPHMKDIPTFNSIVRNYSKDKEYIFFHQPIIGSIAHNGFSLKSGIEKKLFEGLKAKIFAGDIHNPQIIGNVEYVGSPYHVYFGDNHEGHCILFENDKKTYLKTDFPRRIYETVTANDFEEKLEKLNIKEDDQIKVRVELKVNEYSKYIDIGNTIRKFIKSKGGVLVSLAMISEEIKEVKKIDEINEEEVIKEYAKKEGLEHIYIKEALSIINEDK